MPDDYFETTYQMMDDEIQAEIDQCEESITCENCDIPENGSCFRYCPYLKELDSNA